MYPHQTYAHRPVLLAFFKKQQPLGPTLAIHVWQATYALWGITLKLAIAMEVQEMLPFACSVPMQTYPHLHILLGQHQLLCLEYQHVHGNA